DTVFNVLAVDPLAKDVLRGTIVIAAVALYARGQCSRAAVGVRFASGVSQPPEEAPGPTVGGGPRDREPAVGGARSARPDPPITQGRAATRCRSSRAARARSPCCWW